MKNRLELMWLGKRSKIKLEPRLTIEDKGKSYGDDSNNKLIHGDNLLALKAIEQEFSGKIKLIYIDPPFNTGNAFEHYDDNLEHSMWLNLMYQRIELLRILLRKDGVIAVHLDDQEVHYMKVIMDEIFGRNNFITSIAVKSSTPSGLKTAHRNKTIIKQKDTILIYKGNSNITVNPQYIKREKWDTHYSNYFDVKNKKVYPLIDVLVENNIINTRIALKDLDMRNSKFEKFYLENQDKIFQTQPTMPEQYKKISKSMPDKIIEYNDADGNTNYAKNGRRFVFLNTSVCLLEDGNKGLGKLLCDFWDDIDFQNTQNEGGVSFPSGKKPEKLVARLINLFTNEQDWVLDSFLGSGTTISVAQKMNRRWIGIELGNHCYTHSLPRIKRVIDGHDPSGVTKQFNWQGGGGFKFYELAPSLLKQDKYDNWIIDTDIYTASLVAAAVAKYHGFTYYPDQEVFWKQGYSYENDYIFTTDQMITIEYIDLLHSEMKSNESLLICCSAYQQGLEERYENINIQKIPQSILDKYDFGVENYNMDIDDSAVAEVAVTIDEEEDENE